jgi:hypothetical protein
MNRKARFRRTTLQAGDCDLVADGNRVNEAVVAFVGPAASA